MANPSVRSTSASLDSGSGTHTHSFPGTMVTGDTCVFTWCIDSEGETPTWPAGFNLLKRISAQAITFEVREYEVTGSEGSTFDITGLGNEVSTCVGYCIQDAQDPDTMPPEVSTGANGASANPDPDSITAGTSGYENMFIACCGCDRRDVTNYPTNCPDSNINEPGASGPGGTDVGMASDQLTQETFNPDTFTISASDGWAACTVVVYGDPAPVTLELVCKGVIIELDHLDSMSKDNPKPTKTLTNNVLAAVTPLDKDLVSEADLQAITAGETLQLSTSGTPITDTDLVSTGINNQPKLLSKLVTTDTILDDDSITAAAMGLTWKLTAPLDDEDSITAKLDGLVKLVSTGLIADDDTISEAVLRVFMRLVAPITDDDVWSAAKLDGISKLVAALTDDDSLTEALATVLAKLASTGLIDDIDTISEANLVIVAATLLTASLTESDTISEAVADTVKVLVAALSDTDTISEAAVSAAFPMSANINEGPGEGGTGGATAGGLISG